MKGETSYAMWLKNPLPFKPTGLKRKCRPKAAVPVPGSFWGVNILYK